MKKIIGIIFLGIICYYGVKYYYYMNSGKIEISPELVTIVDDWKIEMDSLNLKIKPFNRIRQIIIVDDHVVDYDYAYCSKRNQVIYIARSTITKGPYTTKAAVWHELGHYIFELKHKDQFSIMNTYGYSEREYRNNWDELRLNYFKYCKRNEEIGRY